MVSGWRCWQKESARHVCNLPSLDAGHRSAGIREMVIMLHIDMIWETVSVQYFISMPPHPSPALPCPALSYALLHATEWLQWNVMTMDWTMPCIHGHLVPLWKSATGSPWSPSGLVRGDLSPSSSCLSCQTLRPTPDQHMTVSHSIRHTPLSAAPDIIIFCRKLF